MTSSQDVPLRKQEAILIDKTGSIKKIFWEDFVDCCQQGTCYRFKNVKVKKFMQEKSLNTPRDGNPTITEIAPLEGPFAEIDVDSSITTTESVAKIM